MYTVCTANCNAAKRVLGFPNLVYLEDITERLVNSGRVSCCDSAAVRSIMYYCSTVALFVVWTQLLQHGSRNIETWISAGWVYKFE